MTQDIIKIFLTGWVVLLIAIVANVIATRLGLMTWYPFIEEIQKIGFLKSLSETSLLSKTFLFLIYPLLLGLSAFLVFKNLK